MSSPGIATLRTKAKLEASLSAATARERARKRTLTSIDLIVRSVHSPQQIKDAVEAEIGNLTKVLNDIEVVSMRRFRDIETAVYPDEDDE